MAIAPSELEITPTSHGPEAVSGHWDGEEQTLFENDLAQTSRILAVDDQPENLRLLQAFLESGRGREIRTTTDPRRAVDMFETWAPDLVLVDIHMAEMSGYEVIARMRQRMDSEEFLPIVIVTADTSPETKLRALGLGATDFLTKPLDMVEVQLRVRNLLAARFSNLELRAYRSDLEVLVKRRTRQLEEAQRELVDRLARAAEYRDDLTGLHTRRVGRLTAQIAERLGYSSEEVELIGLAAPLHDVGKIAVPDRILLKPGRLTPEEFEVIKRHVTIGEDILRGSESPILQTAASVALAHHERWDGSGYLGLAGEEIPRIARIVAVADVFDALVSERPYKEAWPTSAALSEMKGLRGQHFDPAALDAFLDVVDDKGLDGWSTASSTNLLFHPTRAS